MFSRLVGALGRLTRKMATCAFSPLPHPSSRDLTTILQNTVSLSLCCSCLWSRSSPASARHFSLLLLTAATQQRSVEHGGHQLEIDFCFFAADVAKPVPSSGRTGLAGFLEEKTGVTGAGTLGVGVAAYLLSKEIYIINNETVVAVVMGGVIYALLRKVGKPITEYIDTRNQV